MGNLTKKLQEGTLSRRDMLNILLSVGGTTVLSPLYFLGCEEGEVNVSTPSNITIDPAHLGAIEGKVLCARIEGSNLIYDVPPEWAKIRLSNDEESYKTDTIYDGSFFLDNIPAGAYELTASRWPYWGEDKVGIIVRKQEVTTAPLLKLETTPYVVGHIRLESGTPLINQEINVMKAHQERHSTPYDQINTGSEGELVFRRIHTNGGNTRGFRLFNDDYNIINNRTNNEEFWVVLEDTLSEENFTAVPR